MKQWASVLKLKVDQIMASKNILHTGVLTPIKNMQKRKRKKEKLRRAQDQT